MSPWARRATRPIPRINSPVREYELNDYAAGMDSYTGNDKFQVRHNGTNRWRLAQNARIITTGEYETRKGIDFYSDPAGEAVHTSLSATSGAAAQTFNENTWQAQKWTATGDGRLSRIAVRIRNASSSGTGTVLVEHWSDNSGSPGTLLSRSSVAASTITVNPSFTYYSAYFPDAPDIINGTVYWIIVTVQPSGNGGYTWSSTATATTAKNSTDSGATWNSTSYALNFIVYLATAGGVKGMHRAYKSDGTKVTLMAHGTSLYKVDEVTGALTAIKTGLNASATRYRFVTVNDIVYYVNGYDGYRKWDFTTESQVNATNYSDLGLHKGLMFLVRMDDKTRVDFSNFGIYETFTSTDFQYIPAPKTGDNVASFTSFNGYAIFRTQNRAYILSGDNNETFRLDESPDQKGTYTPETSCTDKSYEFFLSDDGVYRSNGSQPELISENIYQDILSLPNKDECIMEVNKGRLYLWHKSAGSDYNDQSYVWNLNYKSGSDTVESLDTKTHVNGAISAWQDDDALVVGSSRLGMVYWQELVSNDWTNHGGDIEWQLQTHYFIGSSASILKEIRYWQPRFGAADDNYTCDCDYAYDLRENWQTHSTPDVQGVGSIWGQMTWGAFTWGATSEVTAQLYVPGEYRRVALRYKHYATRQPQRFLGHTMRTQERRMR